MKEKWVGRGFEWAWGVGVLRDGGLDCGKAPLSPQIASGLLSIVFDGKMGLEGLRVDIEDALIPIFIFYIATRKVFFSYDPENRPRSTIKRLRNRKKNHRKICQPTAICKAIFLFFFRMLPRRICLAMRPLLAAVIFF